MTTYRERRERRVEQLTEYAGKNESKSAAEFEKFHQLTDGIPFGQPILVGHHSEKRHRRTIDRAWNALGRGVEHAEKEERQRSTAAEIERQMDRSIYSDDEDAIERLEERIEALEAERARIKAINAAFRKHKIDLAKIDPDSPELEQAWAALEPLNMTAEEWREIGDGFRFLRHGKGYPPYTLKNLGGNINRQKKRLAALKADAARKVELAGSERHTVTLTGSAVALSGARGRQRLWWLRDETGDFIDLGEDHPGDRGVSLTLELPNGRYTLGCGRKYGGRRLQWIVRDGVARLNEAASY